MREENSPVTSSLVVSLISPAELVARQEIWSSSVVLAGTTTTSSLLAHHPDSVFIGGFGSLLVTATASPSWSEVKLLERGCSEKCQPTCLLCLSRLSTFKTQKLRAHSLVASLRI